MNAAAGAGVHGRTKWNDRISAAARLRLVATEGTSLFLNDWLRVLMVHYQVDPQWLQRMVPFPLDLRDGYAWISLVAFSMERLRPLKGGFLSAWASRPLANHEFFNVRTYVRHHDESGIYFLAEWIPNRLAAWIGPRLFGLPYKLGCLEYDHDCPERGIHGRIRAEGSGRRGQPIRQIEYSARMCDDSSFKPAGPGTRTEWLMERYTAFTVCRKRPCLFRIWHPPWPQNAMDARVTDEGLLSGLDMSPERAQLALAHYAPGVKDVWVGRPQWCD